MNSSVEVCGDGADNNGNGAVDEGCGCDAGGQDCCAKSFGKPVDATSGVTSVDDQTDIRVSLPGVPLLFARRYVQRNGNYPLLASGMTDRMVLGPGWSHTYDLELQVVDATTVIVTGGTRPDLLLKRDATGDLYRAAVSGEVAKQTSGLWAIHYPDGTRAVLDSANRLQYIANRDKRGVRVARNAANKVEVVTHYQDVTTQTGAGPFLRFTYHTSGAARGMLASVKINDQGTAWTYDHIPIEPTVAAPWSPILGSVTHGSFKRLYEYRVFFPAATEPGVPVFFALSRVIDEAGTMRALRELHAQDDAGKTVRTVSEEGDFSFHYESAIKTNIYSESIPGGFCTGQGSCQTGTCEGTCIDATALNASKALGRPCTADANCTAYSPTATCSFEFGRCNAYCTDATVVADCGAGTFCAPDGNVPALAATKAGRCYSKKQVVEYNASSKRVTKTQGCTTGCGGTGETEYSWTTPGDSTLDFTRVNFAGTYRYYDYQYDSYKRITNLTANNTSASVTCEGTATQPCLRRELVYEASAEVHRQSLLERAKSNPALPGGNFGDAYQEFAYNEAGQLTQVSRVGRTRAVTSTGPVPRTYATVLSYTDGRLASINPPDTPAQNGQDNSIALTYWPEDTTARSGQVHTVTRHVPGGAVATQVTTFAAYNSLGLPTSITGPDGVTVSLGYDEAGRLTSVARSTEVTGYAYDGLGRLTKVTLAGGTQCVHYLYRGGGFGEMERVVVSDGCPATASTADGEYAELTYDAAHRVTGIAFYRPGVPGTKVFEQRVEYDPTTGQVKRRYDKGTDHTRYKQFVYDAFQRLTDAGGELCADPSICTSFPNCPCPRTALTRNGLGQVLEVSRQLVGGTLDTTFEYDNAAQMNKVVTAATSSSTAATTYVYDDFGRVVEVTSPDSGTTYYEYDGNDNVIKRRIAVGTADDSTTTYEYDGANRLIAIKHDDDSSHCSAIGVGQNVKLHYDSHVGCSSLEMCENGSTRLVLAEVEVGCDGITPRWQQHWYSYDQQGRVTREKYRWPTAVGWSEPLTVAYQYDSAGSLGEVMLPTGNRIIYTRGGSGVSDARKVTSIQYDFGHIGGPINIVTEVTYQPFGPVASYKLAASCSRSPINVTVSRDSGYLVDDILTSCTGLLRRDLQSDVAPRAVTIIDPSPRSCRSQGDCLAGDTCAGGLCRTSLHNSYYRYDFASRLVCDETASASCAESAATTRTKADYSGENLSHLAYRNPYSSGQTLDFVYATSSNRLASASGPGRAITYGSDGAGRRNGDTEDLLSSPHLEAATREFFYHPSGRLLAAVHQIPVLQGSGPYTKTYDPLYSFSHYDHRGLRIQKDVVTQGGAAVESYYYLYDPEGNLLTEIRYLSTGEPEVFEYINVEGIPVFQRGMYVGGILDMYLVADHLRRPVVGVMRDGFVLWRAEADSLGWTAPIGEPAHMPLRLPGQYEDSETAVTIFDPATFGNPSVPSDVFMLKPPLHYNWHRTYDPMVGRYLEPDPIGQAADFHPYRYVWSDPINWVDLFGLFKLPASPSGLPPGWKLDPTHLDPNGRRYVHSSGDYLDFHQGRPGKPGWRGRDHWHWSGEDEHLRPGDDAPDPSPQCKRQYFSPGPSPSSDIPSGQSLPWLVEPPWQDPRNPFDPARPITIPPILRPLPGLPPLPIRIPVPVPL